MVFLFKGMVSPGGLSFVDVLKEKKEPKETKEKEKKERKPRDKTEKADQKAKEDKKALKDANGAEGEGADDAVRRSVVRRAPSHRHRTRPRGNRVKDVNEASGMCFFWGGGRVCACVRACVRAMTAMAIVLGGAEPKAAKGDWQQCFRMKQS